MQAATTKLAYFINNVVNAVEDENYALFSTMQLKQANKRQKYFP